MTENPCSLCPKGTKSFRQFRDNEQWPRSMIKHQVLEKTFRLSRDSFQQAQWFERYTGQRSRWKTIRSIKSLSRYFYQYLSVFGRFCVHEANTESIATYEFFCILICQLLPNESLAPLILTLALLHDALGSTTVSGLLKDLNICVADGEIPAFSGNAPKSDVTSVLGR